MESSRNNPSYARRIEAYQRLERDPAMLAGRVASQRHRAPRVSRVPDSKAGRSHRVSRGPPPSIRSQFSNTPPDSQSRHGHGRRDGFVSEVSTLREENRSLKSRLDVLERRLDKVENVALTDVRAALPPSSAIIDVNGFEYPTFGQDSGYMASITADGTAEESGSDGEDGSMPLGPDSAMWIPIDGTLARHMWYIPEDVPELYEHWEKMGADVAHIITVGDATYIRAAIEKEDDIGEDNVEPADDSPEGGDDGGENDGLPLDDPVSLMMRMSRPVTHAYQRQHVKDEDGEETVVMIRQTLRFPLR